MLFVAYYLINKQIAFKLSFCLVMIGKIGKSIRIKKSSTEGVGLDLHMIVETINMHIITY
jgi:hypothetical protein